MLIGKPQKIGKSGIMSMQNCSILCQHQIWTYLQLGIKLYQICSTRANSRKLHKMTISTSDYYQYIDIYTQWQ
jgi:hypothetical protein